MFLFMFIDQEQTTMKSQDINGSRFTTKLTSVKCINARKTKYPNSAEHVKVCVNNDNTCKAWVQVYGSCADDICCYNCGTIQHLTEKIEMVVNSNRKYNQELPKVSWKYNAYRKHSLKGHTLISYMYNR